MAIAATGRPPPEVVQPPSTSTPPLSYAAILKSSPTNPTPTVAVENGDKQELEVTIHHQELQHSVVGKFSHGWPEIHYLRMEIPKQCELKAEVKIGLLCNRHVLIRCSLFEDYVTLMSKPCFLIQENRKYHPMRTFKWEPWFSAEEETSIAHTWISFPGLAPNFYHETHLFSFAVAAGKPLAIDVATKNKSRPSCARVKVEIDLLKEHPTKFQIRVGVGEKATSKWYPYRYDFLPKYCTHCKLQGHDMNGCWKVHPDLLPEKVKEGGSGVEKEATKGNPKPISSSANPSRQPHIPPTPATNPTTDKEWITVRRKPNKNRKQKQPPNPPKNSGVNTGTVSPAVLAIENTVAAATQPIATQNPTDNSAGIPSNSDGNQRITADSPTETLAVIPENPTQITNLTRLGNPTQMMTHPTPSAPIIGNPTGLPIQPPLIPNPNQPQPLPSPKPPSRAVSGKETLPDTTQISNPTQTGNETHQMTHPTLPTTPVPATLNPNLQPPPSAQNPTLPSRVLSGIPFHETLPVTVAQTTPSPTPPHSGHSSPTPVSETPTRSPLTLNPTSTHTPNLRPTPKTHLSRTRAQHQTQIPKPKLNPTATAYNPSLYNPYFLLPPQPCTLNKSNLDIPSVSNTRTHQSHLVLGGNGVR
ncbi:hypothetical protein RND71_040243 [Anisodus tanguticus]|uniref:DUF4283 domain-containing protein n=1 Tax=Anisodus tanguticus TaxID=243964 RepID=A0AAE1QSK8_9SOLA|nr:hypothetical protein RND71_040243 [Anisodus tanguticus]